MRLAVPPASPAISAPSVPTRPTHWLLLRGLARESAHWGPFPALLRDALPPGSTVTALDLPGNGALRSEPSPACVAGMVQAYRAQWRAGACAAAQERTRAEAAPPVLLGLSLGAMVAAEWAHRYPGELAGCVLANGSVAGLSPPWQRLRPGAWGPLLAAAWPGRSPERREAGILRLCSARPSPGTAAAWAALARERGTVPANALRQLWAALRYRLPRSAPALPLLVLSSGSDRLVDPRCSAAIASAWRAPLGQHAQAGHELALDAGPWLAAACADFAARLPSNGPAAAVAPPGVAP